MNGIVKLRTPWQESGLNELMRILSMPGPDLKRRKILDRYYIATRYPGGYIEIYNKKDAKEALDIVEAIVKFIRDKI